MKSPALWGALWFVVAALVLGFCARGVTRAQIGGDGIGYYAPLASALFQRDLDLRDELAHVPPALLRAIYLAPDGRLGDPFPVGPAIVWAPAVMWVRSLPPGPRLDAPSSTPARTLHPGFAPRFARAVLWTDILVVLLGGALLAGVLASKFGRVPAVIATLAALFGTPAFYYVLADPAYSHAASFFAVSLLLALTVLDRRRRVPLGLLGVAWGWVALMRWQDAILGSMLAPRLLDAWREARTSRERAAMLLRFAGPALLVFSPQMFFWARIYGRPLLVPPGPDFAPFWRAQILPLLFSTWNGAFVWSPLLALGFYGLCRLSDRRLRYAMLAAIVLEIFVCALLLDWWGGRSFGARRLVSLAPLAALGIAVLLQRARGSGWRTAALVATVVAGCAWSLRLAQYHQHGLLPPNPGNAADYERHYTPGSAHTRRYGYWDYPRLFGEIAESEHLLRITQPSH